MRGDLDSEAQPTVSAELTDERLFSRVKAGDRAALGVLFDRHYDGVFRLCVRLLGDADAAADAAQEAFLRVLRYRRSWRARGSWRGWLHTVTRNACIDRLNARRSEEDALSRLSREIPRARSNPGSLRDERVERLEAAIAALPRSRREALVLRRFHGFSYREIGIICDISESAARVRVHRALQDLRRFFGIESEEATHGAG